MIAKITTKGANWMSMSDDPKAGVPLAWAKAGVMNKGYNSDGGKTAAPCEGHSSSARHI